MSASNRTTDSLSSLDIPAIWGPRMLSVLRIVVALMFMEHGTSKLLGFPGAAASPVALTLPWVAGMLEGVGGLFLLLGLFTRPVAFLLCGEMAVAYWMVHAPKSPFPLLNGGDAAVLYCFMFLYLAVAGGGVLSLDWKRQQSR